MYSSTRDGHSVAGLGRVSASEGLGAQRLDVRDEVVAVVDEPLDRAQQALSGLTALFLGVHPEILRSGHQADASEVWQ